MAICVFSFAVGSSQVAAKGRRQLSVVWAQNHARNSIFGDSRRQYVVGTEESVDVAGVNVVVLRRWTRWTRADRGRLILGSGYKICDVLEPLQASSEGVARLVAVFNRQITAL